MNEKVKVKIIQTFAAYNSYGNVLEKFNTMEECLKKEKDYKAEGISIGPVWILCTENDEFLDDAKGCYSSEEEALNHLKEIKNSHSSVPTDTEGHSNVCVHCGIHYYVFGQVEIPDCTVEKAI